MPSEDILHDSSMEEAVQSFINSEDFDRRFWALNLRKQGYFVSEVFLRLKRQSIAFFWKADQIENLLFIKDIRGLGMDLKIIKIENEIADMEFESAYGISFIYPNDLQKDGCETFDFIVAVSEEDLHEAKCFFPGVLEAEYVTVYDLVHLLYDKATTHPYFRELKNIKNSLADLHICFLKVPFSQKWFEDFGPPPRYVTLPKEKNAMDYTELKNLYDDIPESANENYIREIFPAGSIIEDPITKTERHLDYYSTFVNVINGLRFTPSQPSEFARTIHILGHCMAGGYGADDRYTLANLLQEKIVRYFRREAKAPFRVIGYREMRGGLSPEQLREKLLANIEEKRIKSGDAVLVFLTPHLLYYEKPERDQNLCRTFIEDYMNNEYGVKYLDFYDALRRIQLRKKTFFDYYHFNHRGYKVLADIIFSDYIKPIVDGSNLFATGDKSKSVSADSGDTALELLPPEWIELRERDVCPLDFFGVNDKIAVYFSEVKAHHVKFLSELFENAGLPQPLFILNNSAGLNECNFECRSNYVNIDDLDDFCAVDFILLAGDGGEQADADRLYQKTKADIFTMEEFSRFTFDLFIIYDEIVKASKEALCEKCIVSVPRRKDIVGMESPRAKLCWNRNNVVDFLGLYDDIPEFSKTYLEEVLKYVCLDAKDYDRDYSGKFVNIRSGNRITLHQPLAPQNTVYLFGDVLVFGYGAEDRYTISTLLQDYISGRQSEGGGDQRIYRVEARASSLSENENGFGGAMPGEMEPKILQNADIALFFVHSRFHAVKPKYYKRIMKRMDEELSRRGFSCIHLAQALAVAERKKCFIDDTFLNHRGYRAVASKIYFDYLKTAVCNCGCSAANMQSEKDDSPDTNLPFLSEELDKEFAEYLSYLVAARFCERGFAGAVVMNCNPFSNGHRYLVEKASSKVDILYVFVVEEDKSFFKFMDRFDLVKSGVADLKNVIVLKSGKFIISTLTFSEYFSKESPKETIVDASLDIELFCRFIAPVLDIKTRFVGQEPLCPVTRQYNLALRETLPKHGIKFVEYERISANSEPISASRIRKLLEDRKFDQISRH